MSSPLPDLWQTLQHKPLSSLDMTVSENGTPAKDFLSDGPSPFSLSTIVAPLAGMIRTVVPAAGERIRLAFVDVISAVEGGVYRNALLVKLAAGAETIGTFLSIGPVAEGSAHGTTAPLQIAGEDPSGNVARLALSAAKHTIVDINPVVSLKSNSIAATTTGATSTLSPAAGKQIRVYGASGAVVVESATVTGNSWNVGLNTSSHSLLVVRLPIETYTEDFAIPCTTQIPAGCYVQGATNEDVTITAGSWSDGGDEINFNAVVHWEEITP